MINRHLYNTILNNINKQKILVITGARQVGKTSLIKRIQADYEMKSQYLNCDEPDIRQLLTDVTSTELNSVVGDSDMVFIDEAQRVKNIGLTLKLIHDNNPKLNLIVTGSSALDLTGEISEPLTGRHFLYHLYPLSFSELASNSSVLEEKRLLKNRMIFGCYPDIVNNPNDAKEILYSIKESYLFKDILKYEDIKKPELLDKLLLHLAYQIGNEVSYNELGNSIGVDNETIERYIQLLEKSFVIFRISSFSRNLRNEIKKKKKIYFWDLGIRNAIIQNYKPFELRNDKGHLFENYIVTEMIKKSEYSRDFMNMYFWRNTYGQEIDFIVEKSGKLYAYEIKYNKKAKYKFPNSFKDTYKNSELNVINSNNYAKFIS